MNFNGYKIIVSYPCKTYEKRKAKLKRKVGPKGFRNILVKHHTGWVDLIEDEQIIIDDINKTMTANIRTANKIEKLLDEEARKNNLRSNIIQKPFMI